MILATCLELRDLGVKIKTNQGEVHVLALSAEGHEVAMLAAEERRAELEQSMDDE